MVRSSVEVPAVRPTVANALNQAGSRLGSRLHVKHRPAPLAAAIHQLPGVVRFSPADHHHRIDLFQQPLEAPLVLLRRQADRVDEPDLGLRVPRGRSPPDRGHLPLGRRRLADDAQPLVVEPPDVGLGLDHFEASRSSTMPWTSTCPFRPITST